MLGLLIPLALAFSVSWFLTWLIWPILVNACNHFMFGKWQEKLGYPIVNVIDEMEKRNGNQKKSD